MTPPNQTLEKTFLDLVAIDEVHPHEDKVLADIKQRLDASRTHYHQDKTGNIVARLAGADPRAVALVGHVDIAAPLGGRKVVITPKTIKTDGTGLLGADDKAAVAVMLELADHVRAQKIKPARTVELVFTVGEEAGVVGVTGLDMSYFTAPEALVFDWLGSVSNVVTQSPAYCKIDVEYIGRDAHPAEWRSGKNAGAALIEAAAGLRQGEYVPGVTCNIGIFSAGNARNKVPGRANLRGEIRSFDAVKVKHSAAEIEVHFKTVAQKHAIEAVVDVSFENPGYTLDQAGGLFASVTKALGTLGLKPNLESTYGCFDGNVLAARGLDVVMLGAGCHNPHSPSEYLDRAEFQQAYEFVKTITLG